MNSESIANKIRAKLILAGALIIGLAALVSYFMLSNIKKNVELNAKNHFQLLINERIKAKMDIALSNAITLSLNTDIILALENNDRDSAKLSLNGIDGAMKNGTSLKNVKIHIHDKNIKSFLRAWAPDKYGDDLSSFRETIVEVKSTQKPLTAIEVGRAGLVLRGLAPIFNLEKEYLGSIEYIQGFNSIVADFKKDNEYLLVLMDEKFKRGNALSKEDQVSNYFISQKEANKDFANELSTIDINKLNKDGYFSGKKYFYTSFPIKDIKGRVVGIYVIGEDIKKFNELLDDSSQIIFIMLGIMVILTIVFTFITMYLFKKIVTNGIKKFRDNFAYFLKFVSFKINTFHKPAVYTNDEIGQMLIMLNEAADVFDKKNKEDMKVIGEIVLTMDKVEQGIYKCRIRGNSDNPMIMTMKTTINKMLDVTENNMRELVRTLGHYANDDFKDKVKISQNLKENLLEVMQSVNKLGDALSNNARTNLENGQVLEENSNIMTSSMENLAKKANDQAASLEETAAAVEEITSITRSNAENA
ncbi:methyl-accepting chemotaxis protein, partial [Halarcobacter ebronensis]